MSKALKLLILIWMLVMNPLPAASLTLAEVPVDKVLSQKSENLNIEVHYPNVDQVIVDADILAWVTQLVENFKESYAEESEVNTPYELRVNYTILKSGQTLGLVWEVGSYTGGAHGSMSIVTVIYDVQTGIALDLADIFKNLDLALDLMSSYSQKVLTESLGDMYNEGMLKAGITPDLDNFTSLILTPTGVRIFFSPYQVAPWAAGTQIVDMPLDELSLAGPNVLLWNK